jgi:hypothetical protein
MFVYLHKINRLYTPGDFVAVGLKERKGPISVYIAEVTHVYEAEHGLKYRFLFAF